MFQGANAFNQSTNRARVFNQNIGNWNNMLLICNNMFRAFNQPEDFSAKYSANVFNQDIGNGALVLRNIS